MAIETRGLPCPPEQWMAQSLELALEDWMPGESQAAFRRRCAEELTGHVLANWAMIQQKIRADLTVAEMTPEATARTAQDMLSEMTAQHVGEHIRKVNPNG